MTTDRPRSSERTTFRGLRCMSTDTVWASSCGEWSQSTQSPAVGVAISTTSSDPAAPNRPASHGQPRQHWHQRPRLKIHRGMC